MTAKKIPALLVIAGFVALEACKIGETTYATVELPLREASETRTCDSPFVKPDLSTLTACGDGKGHCFDSDKVPVAGMEACADATKVCVPDKVLNSNGAKLKTCKFFIGDKPGVCVSGIVPLIKDHMSELQQDACDPDERCAPCTNPLDGTDTGICGEAGVHEKACVGGVGSLPDTCCHGSGVCSDPNGIPADSRDSLPNDSCSDGKLCAPSALVDGKPVTCDVLGVSGVCLDVCFAQMLHGASNVIRGGCGLTEVCLPCFIGKGQGMPGCD